MARPTQQSAAGAQAPRVFLSYAAEDFAQVDKLYQQLQAAGWRPWLDEHDLVPGEKRRPAVEQAIADSDFFIACISSNTIRQRGRIQKELRHALDLLQNMLEDDIFLIPVMLENCALPGRLRDFQPVRLHRAGGFDNLRRALNAGLQRRQREKESESAENEELIQLERGADSNPRDAAATNTPDQSPAGAPSLEFRFYSLLAGAQRALEHNRPRRTAAYIQQCLILLLRIAFRKTHGEGAARSASIKQLVRFFRDTLIDGRVLGMLREIITRCHSANQILDESKSRQRAGNLLIEFIALWFWIQRNVLNERRPNMILLRESLSARSPAQAGGALRFRKEELREEFLLLARYRLRDGSRPGNESSSESKDKSDPDPHEGPAIAMHQGALEYSENLENWQRFLANVACFQLRSELPIPFVEWHRHSEELELSFLTVCQSVSVVSARLPDAFVILYIGPPIRVADWCATHRLSTNLRDFIEVLRVPKAHSEARTNPAHDDERATESDRWIRALPLVSVSSGAGLGSPESGTPHPPVQSLEQVAPEIQQVALRDIDPTTYSEYQAASHEATGFGQSNIALLNDDHDLFLALSYPMDNWRLFLHPLQTRITTHDAQVLFIQGGPGTGKTVVLAHRIAHMIQRRQASRGRNFKVIFMAFTSSVAANMREMLAKLNVDPDRILIEDVHGFLARKTRGDLGLVYENKQLIFWQMFRKQRESFLVTDVFFDEFQDFPTRDEDNYIINLIKAVRASGATLTCTYDEHQSIYHSETDLAFWDRLLPIEHQKLSYCYRMAREISEIAYDHRRIMLEHAEDMIRMSTGQSLEYRVQRAPNYAFGGGTVELVPSAGIRQVAVARRVVNRLRKQFGRDEVVIIFFDPHTYGRRHSGKLTPGWYETLKNDLDINIYNPFAIKGLEFRAGVVLFPHYCFMKYYMYLRDGVRLKRLSEFCNVMGAYYKSEILPLSYSHFQAHSQPLDDLIFFLNANPGITARSDAPGIQRFHKELANLGISGALLAEMHESYNRFLSHDLKSLLLRYNANVSIQRRESLDPLLFERIQNLLATNNEKIKKHTRFRRARMIHTEIDHSLRDLNEFYVALTRFREKAYLVYDQEYNLADILPGALTVDEDRAARQS